MELRNSSYPKFWYQKRISFKFVLKLLQVIYKIYLLLIDKLSITQSIDVPVICVGNLTVGGSGKTPFVKLIYSYAKSKGYNPSILVGSYKQNSRSIQINDKTISQSLDEGLIHSEYAKTWQGKNRYLSAKLAYQETDGKKIDLIILDDGLQNYKLKYDAKVVMIGAKYNFANFEILPLGPLRTNLSKILDYDFFVFLKNKWDINNYFRGDLNLNHLNSAIVDYSYSLINFSQINCQYKKKYIVFSGLADNSNFFSSCIKIGEKRSFKIVESLSYKDHYKYKYQDIKKLISLAKNNKCYLLTSYKDLVKIKIIVADTKLESLAKKMIECLTIEAKIEQSVSSEDTEFINRILLLANKNYSKRKELPKKTTKKN